MFQQVMLSVILIAEYSVLYFYLYSIYILTQLIKLISQFGSSAYTSKRMGLFKIVMIVTVPAVTMTYFAFSLGKQLPHASRLFGNYIGLGYLYFKSGLKVLKPQDQLSYEMINVARRASQQSQALRRQLRNTMKKAKQQLQKKHEEVLKSVDKKVYQNTQDSLSPLSLSTQNIVQTSKIQNRQKSGADLIYDLQQIKTELRNKRQLKKQSNKFFEEI